MDKLSKAIQVLEDQINYSVRNMDEVSVELDFESADVILELLKAKREKSPIWKKGKAYCGNCGGCLENKDRFSTYYVQSIRFCKWCGTPVDWSNE